MSAPVAYQPLRGQNALVTGANSGIGEGVARALAAAGAAVVVNYLTDAEAAQRIVSEISAGGVERSLSGLTCQERTRSERCSESSWRPGGPSTFW